MLILAMLAGLLIVPAARGQSPLAKPRSAPVSPKSDTRVVDTVPSSEFQVTSKEKRAQITPPSPARNSELETRNFLGACGAAVDELKASRALIDALDSDNAALKKRLDTEKQATAVLTELNETRKAETEALRVAVAAKNETITAKDAVITAQDKLIAALKQKKSSPWRRIGDVLIGAAVFAIVK